MISATTDSLDGTRTHDIAANPILRYRCDLAADSCVTRYVLARVTGARGSVSPFTAPRAITTAP